MISLCYVLRYIIFYHRCNSFCFKNASLFVNNFILKVRHVLSGVSGIVFAYIVTNKIVPGVFLSRLDGINFRIEEEQYSVWPKIYYLCKTS